MTKMKLIDAFINSSGVLLLGVALMVLIANWSNVGFTMPQDPVFMISMQSLLWIAGAVGLGVAIFCLFAKQTWNWVKVTSILFLAAGFVVYQIGSWWIGARQMSTYLYLLKETFDISTGAASALISGSFLYLLVGCIALLAWDWLHKSTSAGGNLKMLCPACGIGVEFIDDGAGRQIACPHCQSVIVLQEPGDLKMTCVLCGGHVQFPAHALGQKISCPHCAKMITLLKPI